MDARPLHSDTQYQTDRRTRVVVRWSFSSQSLTREHLRLSQVTGRLARDLIALVCVGLCLAMSISCARPSQHAILLEEMTTAIRDTTVILTKIHSETEARAAQPQLMALSQRALDIKKRMEGVVGQKIPPETLHYAQEKLEENETAFRQLMKEASRLQKDPGVWSVLGESLHGFGGS